MGVRATIIILFGVLCLPALAAPTTAPTVPAVSLLTFGPGPAVYERFAHNAIRLQDLAESGQYSDVSFNYGLFNFGGDFIPRFVLGRMRYLMAPEYTPPMLDSYRENGRSASSATLALTPDQTASLSRFLWTNARPENRYYRYDYYRDNCSTRVRDALDTALSHQIRAQTQGLPAPAGHTYRYHTRRILQDNIVLYICVDFLLGQPADRPISTWDEMFLPEVVLAHLRHVTVSGASGQVPLITSEQQLIAGTLPPVATSPSDLRPHFGATGIILGSLMILGRYFGNTRRPLRLLSSVLVFLWLVLGTVASTVLMFMWLFTDHWVSRPNENILQLTPLAPLLLLSGVPRLRRILNPRYLAAGIFLLSLLGLCLKLFPWFSQDNWNTLLWALPVNAAVAMIWLQSRPPVVPPPTVG
jgi:hypothetical protein